MTSGFDAENLPEISQTEDVPTDCRAQVMYYLKCVNSVLELDIPRMEFFTDYNNYQALTPEDSDTIIRLLLLLSPEYLVGKVFIPNDKMCGISSRFHELSVNGTGYTFSVPQSTMIGGKSTRVKKWMAYNDTWIMEYYVKPLLEFQNSVWSSRGINARLEIVELLSRGQKTPNIVCCNIV